MSAYRPSRELAWALGFAVLAGAMPLTWYGVLGAVVLIVLSWHIAGTVVRELRSGR